MKTGRFAVVATAAAAVVALHVVTAAGAILTPIARSGQAAPDPSGGATFGSATAIGNALTGSNFTGSALSTQINIALQPNPFYALYAGPPGALTQIGREDLPAPGMPAGVTYESFDEPVMSSSGANVAFIGDLAGTGVNLSNNGAIFAGPISGSITPVLRFGSPAPGMGAGVNVGGFLPPLINNAGNVAAFSFLSGPNVTDNVNDQALWAGAPGAIQAIGRGGVTQAPGLPAGVLYRGFGAPVLNNVNTLAYTAALTGPGIDSSNDTIAYIGTLGSTPTAFLRSGNHAPDTAAGVNFVSIDYLRLNNLGKVAYQAELVGSGVDSTNDLGYWMGTASTQHLVARQGSQAPGTPVGDTFLSLNNFALSDNGKLIAEAKIAGTGVDASNDSGIWFGDDTDFHIIARTGSAAPDTAATFTSFNANAIAVGSGGAAAFLANTSAGDTGIWITDPLGALRKLIKTGDVVDTGGGQFRTVSQVLFDAQVFNQSVTVASGGSAFMRLVFSDGSSGAFIVALPEPASASFLLLTLAGLRRHRCVSAA